MSTVNTIIGQQSVNECMIFVRNLVHIWACNNDIHSWEDVVAPYADTYDANDGFEIRTGATKIVLVPNNTSYVIKIPYSGDVDDGSFTDYCALESQFYDEAEIDGCEQFFVPTQFLMHIADIPIYIQTKIEQIVSARPTNEEVFKYASIKGSDKLDSSIGGKLVKYYTSEEIKTFLDFISNHNINDLEAARNGEYVKSFGRYVFWDYSGYHENLW